jgi:hypothetical protein
MNNIFRADLPEEPITSLAESAVQMHELFLAYVDAGFSEDQAMMFIRTLLSAAITGRSEP